MDKLKTPEACEIKKVLQKHYWRISIKVNGYDVNDVMNTVERLYEHSDTKRSGIISVYYYYNTDNYWVVATVSEKHNADDVMETIKINLINRGINCSLAKDVS